MANTLYLSTGHVPAEVRAACDLGCALLPGHRVLEDDYGYVIFYVDDEEGADSTIPLWLRGIWDAARDAEAVTIIFDAIGTVDPRFELYD